MAEILSISIDGQDIRNIYDGISLVSYTIPTAPAIKTNGIDVPGAHGVYNSYSPFASTSFTIDLLVEGTTGDQVNQRLREFITNIALQQEVQFVFSDDRTVYRKAKYQNSTTYRAINSLTGWRIQTSITFLQSDPFVYSSSRITISGSIANTESFVINNPGAETDYIMTFAFNGSAPSSGNDEYTEILGDPYWALNYDDNRYRSQFQWFLSISPTDTFTVDGEQYKLYYNDVWDNTQWGGFIAPLAPGDNILTMPANVGLTRMMFEIDFAPRYL